MNKFGIGQPVRRVEDQGFITGRGRFIDDINLPHQCHGALLLSPHAHALIKSVDAARARRAGGGVRSYGRAGAGRKTGWFDRGDDAGESGCATGAPHFYAAIGHR